MILNKEELKGKLAKRNDIQKEIIYSFSVVSNLSELTVLLFDDLRIDEEELLKLNKVALVRFANLYRSKTLKLFAEFIDKK